MAKSVSAMANLKLPETYEWVNIAGDPANDSLIKTILEKAAWSEAVLPPQIFMYAPPQGEGKIKEDVLAGTIYKAVVKELLLNKSLPTVIKTDAKGGFEVQRPFIEVDGRVTRYLPRGESITRTELFIVRNPNTTPQQFDTAVQLVITEVNNQLVSIGARPLPFPPKISLL